MITLDQVRSFVAVAEELHFGRAADRLQMTQPPLSRQIQKLEKSVGVQLLMRDNRRVELTGAGAAFLGEAYRMLNLVEGAGDLARRVDAGAAGVVRVGFTAVSAISILGPMLRRLTGTEAQGSSIGRSRRTPRRTCSATGFRGATPAAPSRKPPPVQPLPPARVRPPAG